MEALPDAVLSQILAQCTTQRSKHSIRLVCKLWQRVLDSQTQRLTDLETALRTSSTLPNTLFTNTEASARSLFLQQALATLLPKLPTMRSLVLPASLELSARTLGQLDLQYATALTDLQIHGWHSAVPCISQLTQLQQLCVEAYQLTSCSTLTRLQKLKLVATDSLQDALSSLQPLTNLTCLDLRLEEELWTASSLSSLRASLGGLKVKVQSDYNFMHCCCTKPCIYV